MRITFLLPILTLNGGVKAVRRIADGLVDRGHDVTMISADASRAWPPPWRPRTLAKRAREALHDARHGRDKTRGAFMQDAKARVVRLPKRIHEAADVPDGDVVIATWWETAESMRALPANKGRKFYFVQADEADFVPVALRPRVEATYRDPFRHICVSHFLAEMLGRFGDKNPALAHVGVDDAFFAAAPRTRNAPPSIGVLYNTDPSKGWNDAVVALQTLRARVPRVTVKSFGQVAVLPQHQLDNMTYELRPSQSRIAELARTVDVWFLPSVREGFGLPAIEAAASGTPMVATRSGGPADYVRNGENGFLVTPSDREGMAHALHDVLTCEDARWQGMSAAARQMAERFRWTNTVEKFERALLER